MKSAYSSDAVHRLTVLREARMWFSHHFMNEAQFNQIQEHYQTPLYHPNFLIRIVLFIATLLALSGAAGLFFLFLGDFSKDALALGAVVYGIASFIVLERFFLKKQHYKSGVTEAILFQACGFTLGGFIDYPVISVLLVCLIVFLFSAIRYLDWTCTLATVATFAGLIYHEMERGGAALQPFIPFAFILIFTGLYFITRRISMNPPLRLWRNNLRLVEVASLLMIYVAGNYYVVREVNIELSGLPMPAGQDIPAAFLFYGLTVFIPILYLSVGILRKNRVLLRVSLVTVAASVFTFRYYFHIAPPEIALTVAGALLLLIAAALLHYLRVVRNGYTRENLISEKWASANIEAFLISQTTGGNQPNAKEPFKGGGGSYGGGGSTGDF